MYAVFSTNENILCAVVRWKNSIRTSSCTAMSSIATSVDTFPGAIRSGCEWYTVTPLFVIDIHGSHPPCRSIRGTELNTILNSISGLGGGRIAPTSCRTSARKFPALDGGSACWNVRSAVSKYLMYRSCDGIVTPFPSCVRACPNIRIASVDDWQIPDQIR